MSEKREEVLRRYEAGESISKISKTLRINKSLIRSYLRERDKAEKEGTAEAVVYEDAVSGEEALQILDLYDFMAGAYLKEGLATGVLESKDFTEPFTKGSRLSGKALVYLASKARGDGVAFRKLFEALSRLSPADVMREEIRALKEEKERLEKQAGEVAEDLCTAKKSLQEARDYIKVLEKRPADKEKIRALEEELKQTKASLEEAEGLARGLSDKLSAIRQVLDGANAPLIPQDASPVPAETPASAPTPEPAKEPADKAPEEELVSLKDWCTLKGVPYSTATEAARGGRITGLVMRGARYFCSPQAVMVFKGEGKVERKLDLPKGYVSLTEWAPLHGMSRSRAKRLAESGLIPGLYRFGDKVYVHRDMKYLNPDGSVASETGMVNLKDLCRKKEVSYNVVRRKIDKVGFPDGTIRDARYLLVPEDTDLEAFLKKEGPKVKKIRKEEVSSTEGLIAFKSLVESSGVPYMTAVRYIRKAGIKTASFCGRTFVPEGTDLLELKKLYGKKGKNAPAPVSGEAVKVPTKKPEKEAAQAGAGDDAVFNAAVATAAVKNVPVADVCNTVFKVMIDEYGYRLGDSPTFEAVRAENGERDFMAVLKNFDMHYQRLNAG